MRKDWSKTPVIKKWLESREVDGKAIRDAVWKKLEPTRKALER